MTGNRKKNAARERCSIRDLAEYVGLSTCTVSKVLNGRTGTKIPEATRERVLAAARELHYVPNAAARNLKQQASRIVGIISGKSFFNECGQRRVRMLEEALREAKHYTLLGGLPGSQEELNELLRSWTGIVEAVIFLAWPPGWNAERLSSLPIRFLFIDCELSGDGYDRIETDRTSGVAAAVTELIRAGRRRIVRVGMDGAVGRRAGFEQAVAAFRGHYAGHCRDNTRPYPQIMELLEELTKRGLRLGIVSNKSDREVKELNRAFFRGMFPSALGEREGVRRKPEPDSLLEAMKELRSSPESTLYVGDSEVDILTAANAGVACLSVTWGFRSEDFLRESGATQIIHEPLELLKLL